MAEENLSFMARLKRHHIFRVASVYAIAAWILIQVANAVFPDIGLTRADVRIVLIVVALGFPVVLVLGWMLIPPSKEKPAKFSSWQRLHWRLGAVLSLVVIVLVAVSGVYLWHVTTRQLKAEEVAAFKAATPAPVATTTIPAKSIAVLPLANESGDKDEQYFSDGLSDDLITALSQFAGLKVISRNSSFQFRDTRDDAKTIGEKLGVAHLLEGSVQRIGDEVRINAELVNAADSSTLWSQRYDRPYKDLFKLQDDITNAVADALKAKLLVGDGAMTQSDRPPSGNLAAYNAYLQGNFYGRRNTAEDMRKAIGYYEEAVHIDPKYALAYSSLSRAEVAINAVFSVADRNERDVLITKARAAANTALALQPDLGAAHQARAFILQVVDFDLVGAEAEYRRAAELAPQDAATALSLGVMSAAFGRLDEAVAYGRRSIALDPLSSNNYVYLARTLNALGRYDEAEAVLRKAIEVNPQGAQSYCELAVIQILRGHTDAAVKLAQQETDPFWRTYALALAHFANGDRAEADAALKELLDQYADTGAFQIAQVYALRKEPDKVFEWLDHGLATRDPGVTMLRYAAFVRNYSADPRFVAFCKKVGLPAPKP